MSRVGALQTQPKRPELGAPWYAAAQRQSGADRPQLHEYRGSDFMQRFDADLDGRRLVATRLQGWYQTNRLDGHAHPTLRQAIHDGFYLIACELSCSDRARSPLDPSRVKEAWAELHPVGVAPLPAMERLNPGLSRMLAERSAGAGGRSPDGPLPIARILSPVVAAGAVPRIPLRPRLVTDAAGRGHTLVSGHLPITDRLLGGASEALPTPDHLDDAAATLAARFGEPAPDVTSDHVLWGDAELDPRLGGLIQLLDENLGIGIVDDRLSYTADFGASIDDPVAIDDWRTWLGEAHFYAFPEDGPYTLFRERVDDYRVVLNRARAHVSPAALPATAPAALRQAIIDLAQALTGGRPTRAPRQLAFDSRYHYSPERISAITGPRLSHAAGLRPLVQQARTRLVLVPPGSFPPGMVSALADLDTGISALRQAGEALNDQFADPDRYRRQSLSTWLERGRADTDQPLDQQLPTELRLIVPGTWIAAGPDLIRRRWRMLVGGLVGQWQAQPGVGGRLSAADAAERLYQVSVHARVRGDHGCEYLVHSAPSLPFHVASYYETRLMPPRPIQMPSLKDLKKAVSGAAMILPEDLNAEVSKLRFPDGKVESTGIALAGRWIYVFSIPIVTICAMILLMLMITILDIIFRWIPYAILRIPLPR